MDWILLSFEISVIAWAYAIKLTEPDMLLGGLKYLATELAQAKPWTEWILKPVLLCAPCVAGQMALWTLVLYGWLKIEAVLTVIDVLFFLSLTLVLFQLLNKFLND